MWFYVFEPKLHFFYMCVAHINFITIMQIPYICFFIALMTSVYPVSANHLTFLPHRIRAAVIFPARCG